MMTRIALACICTSLALVFAAKGQEQKKTWPVDVTKLPPPATKKNVTYASDIKAILDNSCIRCHGEEKPKARLRLDSLEGILKGSHDGKVVVPGQSVKSQMVISIAHQGDPDFHMPPPNNKAKIPPLTPAQVGLVRAWIDQGAK